MQLYISHDLKKPLSLPINYMHILQSIIYHALATGNSSVHDNGYSCGDRKYKDFTFSWLDGPYQISGKSIIFEERLSFEVRSTNPHIIHTIAENIKANGITYLDQHYEDVSVKMNDKGVEDECVAIRMVTPICVYSTDEYKHTIFYEPTELEFYEMINDNFRRKYIAIMGVEPKDDIVLRPSFISDRDCKVTKYKGFYIKGFKGEYILEGNRKYLDFLYQTGLGSKNSKGFGMFNII